MFKLNARPHTETALLKRLLITSDQSGHSDIYTRLSVTELFKLESPAPLPEEPKKQSFLPFVYHVVGVAFADTPKRGGDLF